MPVRIFETASALESIRDAWFSWPGTRDSDVDFFRFLVGVRPEVLKPQVLLATKGQTPDAMLVGRLEKREVSLRFGYWHFHSPRIRVIDLVDGGLRGNASCENIDLLVGHVLDGLRQGAMDLAVFERLQIDSLLYERVHHLSQGFARGISRGRSVHRYLDLPTSSEELYQILPPEHRQNYRRKGRKLLNDFAGDVTITCYQSVSDLERVFRDIETIAQKTYQRGLGFGFQDTPEMRGRLELAAAKGWLRVRILYVKSVPVAYWVAMAYGDTLWGDFIGYDPEYRRYSPGMYLSLTALGEMCDGKQDRGITRVDYGGGDAEYKALLSNRSHEEEDVWIYGRTLRARAIYLFSTPLLLADRSARRVLGKTKLLADAKRLWRDRASRSKGQNAVGKGLSRAES